MRAIAVTLPVDLELYDSCVQNESTADLVEQNAREASIAGMTATPSFVLKTGSRAIVVSGNYYGQIANGIAYLLETASSTAR
jgi:protein-disulfide isomerase